jgi:hypothetical protein
MKFGKLDAPERGEFETRIHLATDPLTQPLGHVTEIDGREYVTVYRRNHLELWLLGDMGSGGTATMELLSRMPRARPQEGAEQ